MANNSMDLSHHLSDVARSRGVSPLKGLQKYFGKPGIISLAGGLPSPAYFPFESTSAEILPYDAFPTSASNQLPTSQESTLSWLWKILGVGTSQSRPSLRIPKYPEHSTDLSLSTALQYSRASGLEQLGNVIKELTAKIYQPAFGDWTILMHTGNTDGWAKAVLTLCNPGEGVLVDKLTYPSAMATMLPYNIRPISIPMDNQGTRPDALREILTQWDVSERNMPRPHVMYTIPVGENPVGLTMSAARKQEIYTICREFDIIIVEDDPYYFLQLGSYAPKWQRSSTDALDTRHYLNALVPSFLRFDTDGRVIRLDSFSKTVAPGVRLGWFTCNPLFAERLERIAETSTQAPCGLSQSLVCSLLLEWKYDGYVRWVQSLAVQYKNRRDFMLDCIGENFLLQQAVETKGLLRDCEVFHAYSLSKRDDVKEKDVMSPWFSFVAPTAGMFIWINVHFEDHPLFASVGGKTLEMRLWTAIAESGVLFAPGWMFDSEISRETDANLGHFRISYSNAEYENMKKGIKIFSNVLGEFYRLKA